MNLQNFVDNINNSQHRITGYTPNKIQEEVLENNAEIIK